LAMWSKCECVRSSATGRAPHSSTAATSGAMSAPESTKTAGPPSSNATTYAFDIQSGCILRAISTSGRLAPMAGLMSRTALGIKSKYSKLLNRAENPTETLDYSYEQMLEQLQNMKRGVADVATAKKRIELQQQKLEQNVVTLESQARQAVTANRDDLATQALQRKAVAQQQLQDMDGQVKQLQDQQDKLVDGQQQLQT